MFGKGHIYCSFNKGGLSAALKAAGGNKRLVRFAAELEQQRLAAQPKFAPHRVVAISRDGFVMGFGSSRFEAAAAAQFI